MAHKKTVIPCSTEGCYLSASLEKKVCALHENADDLLLACKAQMKAIDTLFALLITKDNTFRPTQSGAPWRAMAFASQAIDKAEGKAPRVV